MKITKRQLRRIIKEEKARLMSEMVPGRNLADDEAYGDIVMELADRLAPIVREFVQAGLDEADMDEAWLQAKGDYI